MRIEVDSIYYYDVLNIYDRLCNESIKKYGCLSRASHYMGKHRTYLYSFSHVGSVNNLFDICKKLDLDFGYILTGKKSEKKDSIDLKKILKKYELKKSVNLNPIHKSIRTIMCLIRTGRAKNIRLATLLYLSEFLSTNPLDLI